MRRARLLLGVAMTVLVVAALLAWWSGRGPQVAAAPRGADPACERAAGAYPDRLGRLERTTLDVPGAATYGDPAVVVRCGLAALAPTSDECVDVNGVGWVVRRLSDGTRLSSYGTDPAIEVLVPAAHGPAPLLVPGLTTAAGLLPKNGRACVG